MRLYNTLSKTVEDIVPQNAPEVTVYTCGPTVYDYPHVGNWFTFIRYDLLIRTLKAADLQPKWVMNITDVGHLVSDADEGEDKLEKGARREGKTAWDVAKFYGDYFERGLTRLNISRPNYLPKATNHIQEQIELIQKLETKDYTYTTSDGVYFDTSKFPRYAEFAQLDLDEQQAGARVEHNPEKRNATDFALWKFSPENAQRDMEWDNPFGNGRKGFPGWHIECSAMSMKYLGETLDIHSGGIDHIPIHHTNEIAQSEAVTGKPFAKYWMHTNHISVNGEKISKSLGNGITLEDIEAKGYSLEAFHLHVIESHYRSQSKFSWESLDAAQNRLKNWQNVAALQWQATNDAAAQVDFETAAKNVIHYVLSDLNTPKALAEISVLMNTIEAGLLPESQLEAFRNFLATTSDLLGVTISAADITTEQKTFIAERETARTAKNWANSDQLRDRLAEQGIGLRDVASGAIWYRL
jgi:cysteinyl-tRNA synthetase